jgi:preprotein translocase subunit SecF
VIHDFAFALLVGVIVGTYSSIFIASPILLVWDRVVKKQA